MGIDTSFREGITNKLSSAWNNIKGTSSKVWEGTKNTANKVGNFAYNNAEVLGDIATLGASLIPGVGPAGASAARKSINYASKLLPEGKWNEGLNRATRKVGDSSNSTINNPSKSVDEVATPTNLPGSTTGNEKGVVLHNEYTIKSSAPKNNSVNELINGMSRMFSNNKQSPISHSESVAEKKNNNFVVEKPKQIKNKKSKKNKKKTSTMIKFASKNKK